MVVATGTILSTGTPDCSSSRELAGVSLLWLQEMLASRPSRLTRRLTSPLRGASQHGGHAASLAVALLPEPHSVGPALGHGSPSAAELGSHQAVRGECWVRAVLGVY